MNQPLNAPNRPATPTGTTKARAFPISGCERPNELRKMIGASAPEIAISEPTERSMPPVAMTSVMPTETMTMVATWVRFTFSVCQAGEMRRHREIECQQHDERRQRGVAARKTP